MLRIEMAAAFRAGEEIELAIRPERIRLAGGADENVVEGRITGVVYQGVQTEVTAEIPGGQRLLVFVAEPAPVALVPGQPLRLHLPADAFMRLHAAGPEAGR
jgi:ABC-type Fe3+/spermidine/putrescine transport system ATPase subunit